MRTLRSLILASSLVFPLAGDALKMVSDPPEGFIHLRESGEHHDVDRFLAVAHVTSIEMQGWGDDPEGGAAIVIRTAEVEPVDHRGAPASRSVRHILRFESRAEARKVLKALLAAAKKVPGDGG